MINVSPKAQLQIVLATLVVAAWATHARGSGGEVSVSGSARGSCGRDGSHVEWEVQASLTFHFLEMSEQQAAYGEAGILVPNSWWSMGNTLVSTDVTGTGPLYIEGIEVVWVQDDAVAAKIESQIPSGSNFKWQGYRTTAAFPDTGGPRTYEGIQQYSLPNAPSLGSPVVVQAYISESGPGAVPDTEQCTLDVVVPTLSGWGLVTLAGLLLLAGFAVIAARGRWSLRRA